MATKRQPAKKAVIKSEPKEETTQIEVVKESEYVIHIRPDLFDKLMKIGDEKYWQSVLENFSHNINIRNGR